MKLLSDRKKCHFWHDDSLGLNFQFVHKSHFEKIQYGCHFLKMANTNYEILITL